MKTLKLPRYFRSDTRPRADPERAENKIKMEKEKTRELRKTIYEKSDCCDEF